MICGYVVTAAITPLAQTGDTCGVVALQSGEAGVAIGFNGAPTAERFGDGVVGEHDGAEEERCHDLGESSILLGGRREVGCE